MKRKAALELSLNFFVILIICIVVFSSSVYIIKKFFRHAETIKDTYSERTEKEIERILDDGSKVAIPFDKKTIYNGESDSFGIGILNMLNTQEKNEFKINISFNKAFDKKNNEFCSITDTSACGEPEKWLRTSTGAQTSSGVSIQPSIKNNEQKKFLLVIEPKNAPSGTYVFDLTVCYNDEDALTSSAKCDDALFPDIYDTLHKLYIDVP